MCGWLKPTRPGPLPVPGRLHCGYHSGKARTDETVAKKLCLFFEGCTSDGRSHKEEKKRDKNIPKVWSIIGRASLPFLCASTAQSRTVETASSPSETLHFPPCSSLLRCPPIRKVSEAHLTSLLNKTLHWIATLDYIIMISSWFVAPAGEIFWIIITSWWCRPAADSGCECQRQRETPQWQWLAGQVSKRNGMGLYFPFLKTCFQKLILKPLFPS